jgi:hypothetical protein
MRRAYNCKRMRDATVNVEASRLMDHPRIDDPGRMALVHGEDDVL